MYTSIKSLMSDGPIEKIRLNTCRRVSHLLGNYSLNNEDKCLILSSLTKACSLEMVELLLSRGALRSSVEGTESAPATVFAKIFESIFFKLEFGKITLHEYQTLQKQSNNTLMT